MAPVDSANEQCSEGDEEFGADDSVQEDCSDCIGRVNTDGY
jgi:hypothetical protein